MTLTGEQRNELMNALISAFYTKPQLKQFVSLYLNKNLDAIALGEDLQEIVLKLIEHTEAYGWENELIFAASDCNPGNPKLATFVRVYAKEYWQKLAQKANLYELEELDASNAIVEVKTKVVQVIESQANVNDQLMQLLREILAKLNEPGTPAAAKAKLALPLIPGIVSYEVEMDTENALRMAFKPIRKLFNAAK